MFFRRSIKRYVVLAVAAPFAGRLMVSQAQSLRARSGPSRTADRLEKTGTILQAARLR